VALGRFNLRQWRERGTINREVASYTIHPDYTNEDSGDSDLAILILRTAVEYSLFIKPICLWIGSNNLDEVVNRTGYVVGWGQDEFGNPNTAEPRMARVPIVSEVRIFTNRESIFRFSYFFVIRSIDKSNFISK